ncbi:MAG TPA: hypothetical protein DIS62_01770 [Candidatus Kerfeldbacteria bacterium]|nr:hypothetical protein [Candidatus Kerfeldbacteria bacterium]
MKNLKTNTIIITATGGLFVVMLAGALAYQWPSIREKLAVRPQTEEIDTSDWLTYRDEELGISFKYPANYSVSIGRELQGFDVGLRKNISVAHGDDVVLGLIATSADYGEGVGEGTKGYVNGQPVDLNDFENLYALLNDNYIAASQPRPVRLNEIIAARYFYAVSGLGSAWINEGIILPLESNKYSNVVINLPIVTSTPSSFYSQNRDEMKLVTKKWFEEAITSLPSYDEGAVIRKLLLSIKKI